MDIRWDPFGELANIRERINRLFEERVGQRLDFGDAGDGRAWTPRVDIYETDSSIVFEAELSGLTRDGIDIELDGDRLTIKGMRVPAEGREYLRVERPSGPFHRSFALGVPIDASGVTAQYRDGVLTVALPKVKQAQAKQVHVKVE